MKIILFAGFAQNGKSLSADMFSTILKENGLSSFRVAYGDYLKFVCEKYWGWNGKKDKYGRTLLQKKGTEEARDNNPDVWVNVVVELTSALATGYDFIIIDDFRYPNEQSVWVDRGHETFSIWVHRKDFINDLTEEQKNHRSETSLLDFGFDHVIAVNSGQIILKDSLRHLYSSMKFSDFMNR